MAIPGCCLVEGAQNRGSKDDFWIREWSDCTLMEVLSVILVRQAVLIEGRSLLGPTSDSFEAVLEPTVKTGEIPLV